MLAAASLAYYASYYDTGLTLTGEQGSNALIAMRMLAGERPFLDLFAGYNLLWFHPISGLFAVVGPNWLAMRIFFLLLAFSTALFGYSLVLRITGQAWLALVAGIFMTLMPGAIFRNYMGFIGVLAATLLVRAYVLDAGNARRQVAWMALAGAGMAVCFLIRIEPSLLISVVWVGLAVIYPLGQRGEFLPRLRTAALGTTAGFIAFAAVHAPFVAHAYQRGFGQHFTAQYTRYIGFFQYEFKREWEHWLGPKNKAASPTVPDLNSGSGSSAATNQVTDATRATAATDVSGRDGRRALPAVSEIFSGGRIYFFVAAIWLPLLVAPVLVLSGAVLLVISLARGNSTNNARSLVVLTTTGCALSLFPQYFFFRPDSVHLNEFMVPFWPASLCSAWVIAEAAGASGLRLAKLWSVFVSVLVAAVFFVSFNALFGRDGSGSIMSSRGADTPFTAMNGVRAKVAASEIDDWEGLRDAVTGNSAPGEYVFTYPYVPIVNVMCDRPTYQWNLYIDNATAPPSFQETEGAVLRGRRKPAVIVVNDRAINKTEHSRFSNWASSLYSQIQHDYRLVGTFFDRVEVFALRKNAEEPGASPDSAP